MIIEIRYKDKSNWNSVSGKLINWTNYSKKFKKERIQPYYVAPEVVQDIWNGKTYDIQHILWDSYFCQLYIRESEVHKFIQNLKSCSQINIIQYEENENGEIVSKLYDDIDVIKTELFQISEPIRVSTTTAWNFTFIFRTNRTIVNKALPIDNVNSIEFFREPDVYSTFHSDYEVLDYVKETETIDIEWNYGEKKTAQRNTKYGFEYLQYLTDSEYKYFIIELDRSSLTKINGSTIKEITYESSLIAEGLWKVIVKGVSNSYITNFDLSPDNLFNITIDSIPYYTDLMPEFISESPDIDTVENQSGINTSTKTITKKVIQYKFYLSQTDAFNLKEAFETRGLTKTADSLPILEERSVSPNKLGYDLYEVIINCLISVTDA